MIGVCNALGMGTENTGLGCNGKLFVFAGL